MPLPTIDKDHLPRHIAIIMDGNGRWAKEHGTTRAEGHEAGAKSVRAVVEACRELQNIEALTLYAFSTENWRRSQGEVETLFRLLSKYIHLELDEIHQENIRITLMGRKEGLSEQALADVEHCESLTENNTAMTLNLAINYGGRAEIVDTARALCREVEAGRLKAEEVTEDTFASHLYIPALSELDLLIRTSGEMRLSNFMLWQASYAEFVSIQTLWPDFRKPHLYEAIAAYQARNRRFGGR
ncbi:MAG: polyprenyl diphosphate synthase [Candidatus Hydrogenedentota bacterium]